MVLKKSLGTWREVSPSRFAWTDQDDDVVVEELAQVGGPDPNRRGRWLVKVLDGQNNLCPVGVRRTAPHEGHPAYWEDEGSMAHKGEELPSSSSAQ